MSADVLREAAALMRDTYSREEVDDLDEAEFHLAVADWLDTAGADLWAYGPLCECGSGCHECDDAIWQPHVRRALAVARAYIGSTQ